MSDFVFLDSQLATAEAEVKRLTAELATLRAEIERIVKVGEWAMAEVKALRPTVASREVFGTHQMYVVGLGRALTATADPVAAQEVTEDEARRILGGAS